MTPEVVTNFHVVRELKDPHVTFLRKARGGKLGGGNSKICYFHPYLGKISNLTNIFQMG